MRTTCQPKTCWRWRCVLPGVIWIGAFGAALAQTPEPPAAEESQRPPHVVAVRISDVLLTGLFNRTIDVQIPVRDIVLDTPITGSARVTGKSHVQLVPSTDAASFAVVFQGTVYSRTVGKSGPAVINGHSITHFTATKQIAFQPGVGFYSLPPRIEAKSECYTDGVHTSRGGVIGRVIQRRAANKIAEDHDELTAIARDRAARRIAAAMEAKMSERVARLNRLVEIRTALAGVDERADRVRFACCTTAHSVLIATQRTDDAPNAPLPLLSTISQTTAPLQVWIHSSLVPEKLGEEIKKIVSNPQQSTIVNALALLPGEFGKDAAAAVAAFAGENHVSFERIGDWIVLDVNFEPPDNLTASTTIRR
jgi:hypothetical protein